MQLHLDRPLLFFDIESTGLNIVSDSIVELSFVKVFPDGHDEIKTWRVCPWDYKARKQKSIDPGASAVNGIKDEDVAGEKKFIEIAPEVVDWLKDSDLAGYNSTKFDLPMLAEEIERARAYCKERISDKETPDDKKDKAQKVLDSLDIDLHSKQMIDVQTIYHYMEPRNLKAAYRFYCGGEDFKNAHSAEADTVATYEVLKGQLDMYAPGVQDEADRVLNNDIKELAEFSKMNDNVDFAGRIIWKEFTDAEGKVCRREVFNFGQHRGEAVADVVRNDPGFISWMLSRDFTYDTKNVVNRIRLREAYKNK